MKPLIDAIAYRLGYVSCGTFDDVVDVYDRRVLELGDEIEALKRRITNLAGMLAGADDRREKQVADLARRLGIEERLRKGAEADRKTLTEAAHAFRAATEDF